MKGFILGNTIPVDRLESPYLRNLNKPLNNVLFSVSGGLGDRILMHPIISFFAKTHPQKNITVVSHVPQLFTNIENIKNLSTEAEYSFNSNIVLTNFMPKHFLSYQLINANCTPYLDYISLNTLGYPLLDPKDKVLNLPRLEVSTEIERILPEKYILFHFSNTESLRSLPYKYITNLLHKIAQNINIPVVVIGHTENKIGRSSALDSGDLPFNVINLLNKTSVSEAIALCQRAYAIVSNDSFPIHAGASTVSKAYIFYFSYHKNNHLLGHYRFNEQNSVEFAWRTFNLIESPKIFNFTDPSAFFYKNIQFTESEKIHMLPSVDEAVNKIKQHLP